MSFICRRLQDHGALSLNDFSDVEQAWLTGSFAKVCCRVDSEQELLEILSTKRKLRGWRSI